MKLLPSFKSRGGNTEVLTCWVKVELLVSLYNADPAWATWRCEDVLWLSHFFKLLLRGTLKSWNLLLRFWWKPVLHTPAAQSNLGSASYQPCGLVGHLTFLGFCFLIYKSMRLGWLLNIFARTFLSLCSLILVCVDNKDSQTKTHSM